MHATSTPTLAQPKNGAFAALGAAAILTAAIGFGAVIGMNLPTTATPTAGAGSASQIESGLKAKNLGNAAAIVAAGSSALAIEQGLAAKSDAGANAAAPTLPFEIGGRDPQATFNGVPNLSQADILRAEGGWYAFPPVVTLPPYPVPGYPPMNPANISAHDAARAAAGWYASAPVVDTVPLPSILYNVGPGLSSLDAARAAKGWYASAPIQDPATNLSDYFSARSDAAVLSYDQIRGLDGWKPFATVPQAPTTDLGDIVPGLGSGAGNGGSAGNTDKVGTSHR